MVDNPSFIPLPGTPEADRRRSAFGNWAREYDRYRPGYPPALFDYLLNLNGTPIPEQRVVDMGAGTGQLSRGFIEAGCHVDAVEPDNRMREVLAETPGLNSAVAGTAEQLPFADASATVIAGAQMWHWVNPELGVPETARVLRPGGVLAIIWNLRDDRTEWVHDMHEYVGLPDSYSYFQGAEVPDIGGPYGSTQVAEFEFTRPSSADELVGLISTFSHVGTSERLAEIQAGVREIANTHPDIAGQETFEVPYVTNVFTAIRG